MLSFIWLSRYPFIAGGGSETYTAGHIRELLRRGIKTRLITIGLGNKDGRDGFPDIPFHSVKSKAELSDLDDHLVFVTHPDATPTKHQAHIIMHCALSQCDKDPIFKIKDADGKNLLAPSKFSAAHWAKFFKRKVSEVPVVYPFAAKCFSLVKRPPNLDVKTRVLFAGRLTPDKGIYTLLTSLHFSILDPEKFSFTATTAGTHAPEGKLISRLLKIHPGISLVPARTTHESMAELLSSHDILVMPTTNQFWQEAFGMLSVEAQHAGCRVVASNSGGLPETDCGGLILVEPDNPFALAQGIVKAAQLGPLKPAERRKAAKLFSVAESVDSLLRAIGYNEPYGRPAK